MTAIVLPDDSLLFVLRETPSRLQGLLFLALTDYFYLSRTLIRIIYMYIGLSL